MPTPTDICTLSLHDALPISILPRHAAPAPQRAPDRPAPARDLDVHRSEEHTSELQSRFDLVCRLLLEKKKHYQPVRLPDQLAPDELHRQAQVGGHAAYHCQL